MATKTFAEWFNKVEDIIDDTTDGMIALYDLPDENYYDWFEDGLTPKQAAAKVLHEINAFTF